MTSAGRSVGGRLPLPEARRPPTVVKLGSSSVTTAGGEPDAALLARLSADVGAVRRQGEPVVVVSSGAVAAGWSALGLEGAPRGDPSLLQAVSAVGQMRLMAAWEAALAAEGASAGQVLLAPLDFGHRQQYLHARHTLSRLLALGVVPVVNENDVVADEEIRFGDNDRLAALVAHLVGAGTLALLTDAPGLFTADPRHDEEASLIDQVLEIDHQLEQVAGGPGTGVGRGGMTSKLAAAKIAMWSGVRTVIADAARPGVLADVVAGAPGVGTVFSPRPRRLAARKLWIAFALPSSGTLVVDAGARRAVEEGGRSLLAAGVVRCEGTFAPGDAVEISGPELANPGTAARGPTSAVFAKGLVRYPAVEASRWLGRRRADLSGDLPDEVVHRDDLVLLG